MKITQHFEAGGFRFDVEPGMQGSIRVGLIAVALACGSVAWWIYKEQSLSWTNSVAFASLAILALAFALGRMVYSIVPGRAVRFRHYLINIPVMWGSVRHEDLQTYEVKAESNGNFTLQFRNAAGNPSLTIERFPTVTLAKRIAALFPIDDLIETAGIRTLIDEALTTSRELSPLFQTVAVATVFLFTTAVAVILAAGTKDLWFNLCASVAFTAMTAFGVRREQGVIRHSVDERYLDFWVKQGLFRIVEFRQWLGPSASQEIIKTRRSFWVWGVLLLCILQATTIHQIDRWNHRHTTPLSPQATDIDMPDPETIRQGTEIFLQALRQREASGNLAPPPEPPEKE